jgi:hypothetical protein
MRGRWNGRTPPWQLGGLHLVAIDRKRGLLHVQGLPDEPNLRVVLPMLDADQARRKGGRWEPRLVERFPDGTALGVWHWVEDAQAE